MADFKIAIKPILAIEGGWVNDSSDSGGETYAGISKKNFPHWEGWHLVDSHKPLHTGDIIKDAALDALIDSFYRANFWKPIQGDTITNQDVANDLLDSSINMGVHQAVVLCQRTLTIAETGKMDEFTLKTLNNQNDYA